AAEITRVQVHRDDLFLSEVALELRRDDPLFGLLDNSTGKAPELRDMPIEFGILGVKVFRQLLGNRASAARRVERQNAPEHAWVRPEVHASVIIKSVVFRTQPCVHQIRRKLVITYLTAFVSKIASK